MADFDEALYHGTLAENGEAILRIGLVPRFAFQIRPSDGTYINLAETVDLAAEWVDSVTDEDRSIVIAIDMSGLAPKLLEPGDEEGFFRYYGVIEPEYLRIVSDWE